MSRSSTASKSHKPKILHSKYLLGDEIGKGAYGRVYKGLDLHNGDFVAIKQVSLENISQDDLTHIMSEIDLLKGLNHKNIVKYLGSIKTNSHLYIILEYVENGSLANIIKPNKFGAFPETLVAVYIAQVLEGLTYLHDQGVIHRDIKGANILTTKEGLVKLADFGVATKLSEADTLTDSVVGTPYWMAPEVIEMSGVSVASDIWSVGCTIIELLTCAPPYYNLQPMPALFRIVQDERPPVPENLSPPLQEFLGQCFHKDAKLRPEARVLLKHPWLRAAHRQLQSSLRITGRLPFSDISEEISTVVDASISEVPDETEGTIAIGKDPFDDTDSDGDMERGPRSPSTSYAASEEERRTIEFHQPIRISRKGGVQPLHPSSTGSGGTGRLGLPDSKFPHNISLAQAPDLPPHLATGRVVENGHAESSGSHGHITNVVGAVSAAASAGGRAPPQQQQQHAMGVRGSDAGGAAALGSCWSSTSSGFGGARERTSGGASSSGSNGVHVGGLREAYAAARQAGRSVENGDQLWAERDFTSEVSGGGGGGGGLHGQQVSRRMYDSEQLSSYPGEYRRHHGSAGYANGDAGDMEDDDGDSEEERVYGNGAGRRGQSLPPRTRERSVGPSTQRLGRVWPGMAPRGGEGQELRAGRRRMRSFDEDYSEEEDEMDEARREVVMKQAMEVARLVSLLPGQAEDSAISICDRLLSVFREFPENRPQLVSQLGAATLMEILEMSANERVREKILMVANQALKGSVNFLETLCRVGVVPVVNSYVDPERFCRDVRIQAAYLMDLICSSSALTLQTFIMCRGIPALISLIERDYPCYQEMVHIGVDGVWRILDANLPTPKNELCRLFAKAGIIDRLIVTLQNLNEAYQKVMEQGSTLLMQPGSQGPTGGAAYHHHHGHHGGVGGVGSNGGRGLTLSQIAGSSSGTGGPYSPQPLSPHGHGGAAAMAMMMHHHGPLGPAPPPPQASSTSSIVSRSLSWTRRSSGGGEQHHVRSSTGSSRGSNDGLPPNLSPLRGSFNPGNGGNYGGGGWTHAFVAAGQHSGPIGGGGNNNNGGGPRPVSWPTTEVSMDYANKVADLLCDFSKADTAVKMQMSSLVNLHRLFKLLDVLQPLLLVKVLKCIKQLSTDSSTLELLQKADVIKVMVPFLDRREGDAVQQVHCQALHVLYNVCKLNKQRQEQAAMAGIITQLQHIIYTSNSELKSLAVTLLCDMAHASRRTREELRKHQVLDTYLNLLRDSYWAVIALDSLAVWLAHDHDHKVEQALLKKESLQKLVDFFGKSTGHAFEQILEPFYKIMMKSSRLNTALAVSGLTPVLVARLDSESTMARMVLLKMIRAVYEHHPRPKQLFVEHDLAKKLQRIVEDKREEAVLVKNMAASLLKALHVNAVL